LEAVLRAHAGVRGAGGRPRVASVTDWTYTATALARAAGDARRAWRIAPHWFARSHDEPNRVRDWRLYERLLIKTYIGAKTFRHSLSMRLAPAVRVRQMGNEGLLANLLHVLEVVQRVRPGAPVHIDWTLTGTEGGFRYGQVGEDIWTKLFRATGPPPAAEPFDATAPLDYAFWGNGKDYLTGRALQRQRRD